MYRQSFLVVMLALLMVGLVCSSSRFMGAIPGLSGTPSSYDPKIRVEDAAKSGNKPLLIEFYTDTCHTCQIITPWVHQLAQKYQDDVQFVMVDVNDPSQDDMANIFGIRYVPTIFVFDFKHMAKSQVDIKTYSSLRNLDSGIQQAIAVVKQKSAKH